MNFGFENGKFYIELRSKSRPVKDLYSESLIRAEEISVNSNIVVSNSGGLDSQVMLNAFRKQGIDFECKQIGHIKIDILRFVIIIGEKICTTSIINI